MSYYIRLLDPGVPVGVGGVGRRGSGEREGLPAPHRYAPPSRADHAALLCALYPLLYSVHVRVDESLLFSISSFNK